MHYSTSMPIPVVPLLVLVVSIVSTVAAPSPSGSTFIYGTNTDVATLLAFKAQFTDPLGVLRDNWTTATSICHWVGVSCSRRRSRVTALALQDLPLQGSIAPSLAGMNLMGFISHIPTLKGDNYGEWIKKVDLAFVCGEVDEIITTPKPTEPPAPVRGDSDTDAEWQKKQRDYAPLKMAYDLEKTKWNNANKKCVAVIKNTIDPNILGSIGECDSAAEYLAKIKNQFTGSSKTYATQIIEQLVTKRYYGNAGTIRDHIMGMCALNSKLKPMDLDLKEEFMVHLVFASLPKEFATFVVNYNSQPEKWNMEKAIAMCAQEEDRLKKQNGGSVNFVHNNKKRPFQAASSSKAKDKAPMPQKYQQQRQQQRTPAQDECFHCFDKGHRKADCPAYLKMIMAKNGIPFDKDYAKKRKTH